MNISYAILMYIKVKNSVNIGIHPDVQHLLSTAKAIANVLICSLVSNDLMGYRDIFTDTCYSSIELAIFTIKVRSVDRWHNS